MGDDTQNASPAIIMDKLTIEDCENICLSMKEGGEFSKPFKPYHALKQLAETMRENERIRAESERARQAGYQAAHEKEKVLVGDYLLLMQKYRVCLIQEHGDAVIFQGFNILRGWETFFFRACNTTIVKDK